MVNRDLVHRFWVDYAGTYSELVKEFEEAFENRWYFDKPLEEVTPKDCIEYYDCEISVKNLTWKPKKNEDHISYLQTLVWNDLVPPSKEANYAIDFNSYFLSDTPKTRQQLRQVAEKIPGRDAILTIDNKWISGVRTNGIWRWVDEELLPDLVKYNPKPLSTLITEKDKLLEYVIEFSWKHHSMFDATECYPFNTLSIMPFVRMDWKIDFTEEIDKLAEVFTEVCNRAGLELYIYEDFDEKYLEFRFMPNEKSDLFFTCILQPSELFTIPGANLSENNAFLLSVNTEFYMNKSEYKNKQIIEQLDLIIQKSDLPSSLYKELTEKIKSYFGSNIPAELVLS
jgi:hypothetical protein